MSMMEAAGVETQDGLCLRISFASMPDSQAGWTEDSGAMFFNVLSMWKLVLLKASLINTVSHAFLLLFHICLVLCNEFPAMLPCEHVHSNYSRPAF